MAVANIFARSYGVATIASVSDVQSIIDAIRTLLTSTLAVGDRYTESPTNTFQGPADPVSGASHKLVFVRASATEIQVTVTNKDGTGDGGTHAIASWAGQTCKVYAGPNHFFMKKGGSADNDEEIQSYVVDPAPEAANVALPVNYTRSMRNNGGGSNNLELESFRVIPADGTVGYAKRMSMPAFSSNPGYPNGTLLTAGGSEVALPVFMSSLPGATLANNRGTGAVPQCVWVDAGHTAGQQVVVPIDTGVLGTFEVTSTLSEGFGATGCARLAFRVA